MAALRNLLVVLGFCALFGVSFSTEQCTSVSFGQETAYQQTLNRVYMNPGFQYLELQTHPECQSVGLLVKACDIVAPSVHIQSTTLAYIERLGPLNYVGYADVLVYCRHYLSDSFTGSNEA